MELSNKTLAFLLVGAIAVSLIGTIISLNKLSSIGLTGYATTATGTALVNVSSTTSIRFAVNSVNWGVGFVNTSAGYINCTMNTEGSNSAGCTGFNTVSQGFVLENDGNTMSTVQLRSNASAAEFIGGTADGGGPMFMYKVSNNETGSCASPQPSSYTDVNTSSPGTAICPSAGFNFTDSKDSLKVDIMINIPYTAPPGQRSATLTATAS